MMMPATRQSALRIEVAYSRPLGRASRVSAAGREERPRRSVRKPEPVRVAGVLRSLTDEDAARRIESMTMDQQRAQTRHRLAAPAPRWAGAVRAVLDVDREPERLVHPREHRVYVGRCAHAIGDLRLPRQPEQTKALVPVPSKG